METLSRDIFPLVKSFYSGLILDLCIEPSSRFGMLYPSTIQGSRMTLNDIRKLKCQNLLDESFINVKGLEYRRYTINALARKLFEEDKNDFSN